MMKQEDVEHMATFVESELEIFSGGGYRKVNLVIFNSKILIFDISTKTLLVDVPLDSTIITEKSQICPADPIDDYYEIILEFERENDRLVQLRAASAIQQQRVGKRILHDCATNKQLQTTDPCFVVGYVQKYDLNLDDPQNDVDQDVKMNIEQKAETLQTRLSWNDSVRDADNSDAVAWRKKSKLDQPGTEYPPGKTDSYQDYDEVEEGYTHIKSIGISNIDRIVAVSKLKFEADGSFLFRTRTNVPDAAQYPYALSVVFQGIVHHVKVERVPTTGQNNSGGFVLDSYKPGETVFETLEDLAQRYRDKRIRLVEKDMHAQTNLGRCIK